MKNLKLIEASVNTLREIKEDSLNVCCGYDETEDAEVVFICDNNLSVSKHNLNNGIQYWKVKLPEPPVECKVVDASYLALPGTVTVGLSSGEIWTVRGETGAVEEAGSCVSGLAAMEWSPDQELVVLVTKDNQMILMSYLLDPIAEISLTNEEFGEKNFITVGWGKKETQFHGSEGKQAAVAKTNLVLDENADKDNTPKITWRGDGQMYAVSTLVSGLRIFKVFDRDGHLQYTSEKQDGLEANIAWRPSGNVIATTQYNPRKYIVAFFEKNGLRHGDFLLPQNLIVKDICWSSDSDIIALVCNKREGGNTDCILLYTSSNYHWYLKQTLTFSEGENISKVLWNNLWDQNSELDASKKLHVFMNNGKHCSYNWIWNIDYSDGKDCNDDAVVGVIDGNKLHLTAFRHSVVPPPMSAFQIEVDDNINAIFFGPSSADSTWNSNSVCCYTNRNELLYYRQTSKVPLKYEFTCKVNSNSGSFPLNTYNWLWVKPGTLVCVNYADGYNFLEYNLKVEGEVFDFKLAHTSRLNEGGRAVHRHPTDDSKVFMLTRNGIDQYTIGGHIEQSLFPVHLGSIKLHVVCVASKLYIVTLTYKNGLNINDRQNVMKNVSSIFVHSHFLLITTLQHELICTELTGSGIEALMDSSKLNNKCQLYKRKIERGAKLVVAVPSDTRTIFQLPRGNLETIQPRPLSLRIIGQYLDKCEYHSAFDLMRKQRINLNLIYDHNPEHFVQNVDSFLTEIQNPSWLTLFLSDLENTDVTVTMYASSYSSKIPSQSKSIIEKIKNICGLVRNSLENRPDKDEKILPILTTYVKKNTIEDLEKALGVVKTLKQKEGKGEKLPVGSDEALRYLLYLVDVNYLYDIALGMYDFDLVLLVANKSQKDPKDYVQMLNEFNVMEENYKRFSINKSLKRFGRAVQCLVKCGTSRHEELKSFVKYHSLFRDAMELFEPNEDIYKQIAEDYGLHLKLKKQFTEAAFVYRRGGNVDKAVECFREALEWEFSLECAHSWPKDKFMKLCSELIEDLKSQKRQSEALTILEQYTDDKVDAIKYALECGRYSTSLRFIQKYGKVDLTDSLLKPAIQEDYNNLTSTIKDNTETFKKHKERLFSVRANKLARGDGNEIDYGHKDSDLYSDTGSTIASSGSRGSSRSFKSSKNRRKHERKLVSLKEGSQYEDVALVNALYSLISSSFELRLRAKELNLALCWLGEDKKSSDIQDNLDKLLKMMKESFRDIWSHEFMLEATNASIAAQLDTEGTPQGIAAIDLHIRIPPVIQDINWKLSAL